MSATLDRQAIGSAIGLIADTITFSTVDGPGNRFVAFVQGCNFDCLACHNPQTIPRRTSCDGHLARRVTVDELLVPIRRAAPFLSGITVSGGEATTQARFVHDLCAAVKADVQLARLSCFVDSNGSCDIAVWDRLAHVIDGAMIDLKCFDADIHRTLTGRPNDRVLASIRHLHTLGLLYEVRLLLVAGLNDGAELLRRTGEWLAGVEPSMRLNVIWFRAHGARPHDPPLAEPGPLAVAAAADVLSDIAPIDVCTV
ncbi:MAG: radical SAM protein [Actinobacteria bacterium]|nr:radical SAM protein [Actinomycetota bacterium]